MICVYKTDVTDAAGVQQLRDLLNENLPMARWNFDLDDCDRILRVDSPQLVDDLVTRLLQEKGFRCEALPD